MIRYDDGSIQCRVRIWGHYKGKPFVYTDPPDSHGSQFYHSPDELDRYIDDDDWGNYQDDITTLEPSRYCWEEGNMSCDRNRGRFVGEDINHCSDDIYIDFIQPLEPGLMTLCLMESIIGVINDYEREKLHSKLEKALEGGIVIKSRN